MLPENHESMLDIYTPLDIKDPKCFKTSQIDDKDGPCPV